MVRILAKIAHERIVNGDKRHLFPVFIKFSPPDFWSENLNSNAI